MTQVKRRKPSAQELAATNARNFRTFLLVAQLEAKAIGARIALARNQAGMTQEEMADVATFSKRSLQEYEAGNTIPWRHMREIAALTTKPVEWLLHGEQAEPVPDALAETTRLLERLDALESSLEDVRDLLRRHFPEPPSPDSP